MKQPDIAGLMEKLSYKQTEANGCDTSVCKRAHGRIGAGPTAWQLLGYA